MKRPRPGNVQEMAIAAVSNDVVTALRPTPEAAGAARRALVSQGLAPELDHTVSLLASEVVSNCVRHAELGPDDRIILAARLTPDFARVEVRDSGPGFDPGVRHGASGFGLRMGDTLASRWGVDRDDGTTRVWFEVDRRRRRFDRR